MDHAQTIVNGAKTYGFGDDLVIVRHDKHGLARLIGDDGSIGNEQSGDVAAEQAQATEGAGRQKIVLVVEDGPATDRAGAPIELIVHEVHDAARVHSVSSASRTETRFLNSREVSFWRSAERA